MSQTEDSLPPQAALDAIRSSQLKVVETVGRGGWTYDLCYSLLVGFLVGGWGLKLPYPVIVEGVVLAALAALAINWKRRNGMWISGVHAKRARWVAFAIGAIALGLIFAEVAFRERAPLWMPLAAGGVAALAALVMSRLWRHVYLRENGVQP